MNALYETKFIVGTADVSSDLTVPATDNTLPTYPPRHSLGNYIVARPLSDQEKEIISSEDVENAADHTEPLILYELQKCDFEQHVKSMLLYSWYSPCCFCKNRLVRAFKPRISEDLKIVIIYSKPFYNKSKPISEAMLEYHNH